MSYDPNPEDIISSVIGYTVLTEKGPLLDSQNNVPLTLTSDRPPSFRWPSGPRRTRLT